MRRRAFLASVALASSAGCVGYTIVEQDEFDEMERRLDAKNETIHALEGEPAELQVLVSDRDAEIAELEEAISTRQAELADLENQLDAAEADVDELERKIETTRAEVDELQATLEQIQPERTIPRAITTIHRRGRGLAIA